MIVDRPTARLDDLDPIAWALKGEVIPFVDAMKDYMVSEAVVHTDQDGRICLCSRHRSLPANILIFSQRWTLQSS